MDCGLAAQLVSAPTSGAPTSTLPRCCHLGASQPGRTLMASAMPEAMTMRTLRPRNRMSLGATCSQLRSRLLAWSGSSTVRWPSTSDGEVCRPCPVIVPPGVLPPRLRPTCGHSGQLDTVSAHRPAPQHRPTREVLRLDIPADTQGHSPFDAAACAGVEQERQMHTPRECLHPEHRPTCSRHRNSGSRSSEPVDIMSRGPSRSCSSWSRDGPDSCGLLPALGRLPMRAAERLLVARPAGIQRQCSRRGCQMHRLDRAFMVQHQRAGAHKAALKCNPIRRAAGLRPLQLGQGCP